ncbi:MULTISPECIES: EAL domain-containing protein [Microvirgula]|uniref:EAL domain-containing protein n=1 Tax=Microvirgula aerodenitrificans TaxID=57480 RepID=A0A2S0PBC1_9NEIS|nr:MULTISPECIES: EAL domain-containing protein [Microvirgula]AVY94656.1 hypothetical protein DAI18_11865 [Microvirgula aerodenitrificans]
MVQPEFPQPSRYAIANMEPLYRTEGRALAGIFDGATLEVAVSTLLKDPEWKPFGLGILMLESYRSALTSCGRKTAEKQIAQITETLQQQVEATWPFFRIADDIFVFLVQGPDRTAFQGACECLREQIAGLRYALNGEEFPIPTRMGLLSVDEREACADRLIDQALAYGLLARPTDGIHFARAVSAHEHDQRISPHHWIARIHQSVADDRFVLFSQRILPLHPRRQDEYRHEILLRMMDAQGQIWSPGYFLPTAERLSLTPDIDRWVIRSTYEWLSRHRQHLGVSRLSTSINLSGHILSRPALADYVLEQQSLYGIDSREIFFEITETSAITDLPQAIETILALRQHGYRFALDDYGSGMATLSRMRDLPVDLIKVDGSFIKNIANDPVSRYLVQHICEISRALGREVLAEFVENEAILDCITELGFDYAQGYCIGRPIPLQQLQNGLGLA